MNTLTKSELKHLARALAVFWGYPTSDSDLAVAAKLQRAMAQWWRDQAKRYPGRSRAFALVGARKCAYDARLLEKLVAQL